MVARSQSVTSQHELWNRDSYIRGAMIPLVTFEQPCARTTSDGRRVESAPGSCAPHPGSTYRHDARSLAWSRIALVTPGRSREYPRGAQYPQSLSPAARSLLARFSSALALIPALYRTW